MLMGLIPSLAGRLGGIAVNVPVPDGSIVDLVVQLERPASVARVNELVRDACAGPLSGFIEYEEDPIVSSDVILNPHSGVFDALSTQALGEDLFRVLVWFENGWGYASRVADLMLRLDAVNAGDPGRRGAGDAR
jgi:glyceraldehyde 3-phosphate dehydrogenase